MTAPAEEWTTRAAEAIAAADALLITAGAGMGVDSGLPDFRGPEGFWNAYPAYRHFGLRFADVANPRWFAQDPALAWGFYGHRLHLYRATSCHAGFEILRAWAAASRAGARVFRSNVDGHFQRAGFLSEQVTEVHGSIHHLQCTGDCPGVWSAEGVNVAVSPDTFRAAEPLPRCPTCGALARPNILMFGDGGWRDERTEQQLADLHRWLRTVGGRRLAVIECGAGSTIPTVRDFSERVAVRLGGTLIRINLREPQVPRGQIGVAAAALAGLRAIAAAIQGKRS
jgi:NAD-dependent SIR2 family protein deacetylase